MLSRFTRPLALAHVLAAAGLTALLPGLCAPALAQCDSPFLGPDTTGSTLLPSTAGTLIPSTNNQDDLAVALPAPPFPLRFLGQTYSAGAVSTNGVLRLGAGGLVTTFTNTSLPNTSFGPTIFAYWDDLITVIPGGGIYTNTTGVAPNRVFEVRWQVQHIIATAPFAFSIYFFESPASPEFLIAYAPADEALAQGSAATIGLQAGTSGPAFTYSLNQQLITGPARLTPRCLAQSITYQGRLTDANGPVNGTADLLFTYVSASGTPLSGAIARPGTPVSGGLFTVTLPLPDLTALSAGGVRLRITANGSTLSPDQPLTSAPAAGTAVRSLFADAVPWSGIVGVPSNLSPLLSGATPGQQLSVAGGIRINTGTTPAPNFLSFGAVGNTLGTAENTDLFAFQRVNLSTTPTNSSELRLIIGDDPLTDANADAFIIGTIPSGTWTPRFTFRSDGLAFKIGGGTWAAISDPRTKHDIAPLSNALDLLLSLRGYSFLYNESEITKGRALPGRQIGLMADEVERVFPDWVSRDRDGIRMVTERGTTALTIEALRELRDEKDRQIAALQNDLARRDADLAAQQQQINDLLARLERLERRNDPDSAGKP